MEQTLIVSSLGRNVIVRCERTDQRVSVRFEKLDSSESLVQWNFFPCPAYLSRDLANTWVRNQQLNLGRLLIELRKYRLSHGHVDKVLTFVTKSAVEWVTHDSE